MRTTCLAVLILLSACTTEERAEIADDTSFAIKCSGWTDGKSFIEGETTDLGKSNYTTELRWDGVRKGLTEIGPEGELAYCTGHPEERCNEKVEFGHLTAETSMSGPGSRPDILVRTTSYVDVDLKTLTAVKRTSALSGQMLEGQQSAKRIMEIAHEAQLTCEFL